MLSQARLIQLAVAILIALMLYLADILGVALSERTIAAFAVIGAWLAPSPATAATLIKSLRKVGP